MFVRKPQQKLFSSEKATHLGVSLFFFHFCRKEKWKKEKSPSTELEEERGRKGGWRKMLRPTTGATGAQLPFFPFTRSARLLVQDGSVPFWNTSFLNGAVVKQCIVGQERQAFFFIYLFFALSPSHQQHPLLWFFWFPTVAIFQIVSPEGSCSLLFMVSWCVFLRC